MNDHQQKLTKNLDPPNKIEHKTYINNIFLDLQDQIGIIHTLTVNSSNSDVTNQPPVGSNPFRFGKFSASDLAFVAIKAV